MTRSAMAFWVSAALLLGACASSDVIGGDPVAAVVNPDDLVAVCEGRFHAEIVASTLDVSPTKVDEQHNTWSFPVNAVPRFDPAGPLAGSDEVNAVLALAQVDEVLAGFEWALWEETRDRIILVGELEGEVRNAVFRRGSDGEWAIKGKRRLQCRLDPPALRVTHFSYPHLQADPGVALDRESSKLALWLSGGWCSAPDADALVPVVVADEESVLIAFFAPPPPDTGSCDEPRFYSVTVDIGERLGDRRILNGSSIPGVEVTWPPVNTDRAAPRLTSQEVSDWVDRLGDDLDGRGIDYLLAGGGSASQWRGYTLYVEDPAAVGDTATPAGVTITVEESPIGTFLRDGKLWLEVPDDLPLCSDADSGLCLLEQGSVQYKTGGCINPPTTIPPGVFDDMRCGL